MKSFRLRCRFLSVTKQWIAFLDESREKVLQGSLPSIVRHEPYTHSCAEFVGIADEPSRSNFSWCIDIDLPEPSGDGHPSILQRRVGIQDEADRTSVRHGYGSLNHFKKFVLISCNPDARNPTRARLLGAIDTMPIEKMSNRMHVILALDPKFVSCALASHYRTSMS